MHPNDGRRRDGSLSAGREGNARRRALRPGARRRDPLALLRMRRAQVREFPEYIGVRLETGRRDVSLRKKGEAGIDDVVSEDAAVGVLRGLRRIEGQHVGQNALGWIAAIASSRV